MSELLSTIARQMMSGSAVEVNGKRLPVRRTSAHRFRTVAFEVDGKQYQAIEQNPEKLSAAVLDEIAGIVSYTIWALIDARSAPCLNLCSRLAPAGCPK